MLTNLKKRAVHLLARRRFAPVIEVQPGAALLRLGSDGCGWTFEPSADLQGSTIVSAGLGEDGSFDVEFASRFHAKVIIVDPTPRAVRHFEGIQERVGLPAVEGYGKSGKVPVDSYDLRGIAEGSLILEPSALWVENTTLKFFAPPEPRSCQPFNCQLSEQLLAGHFAHRIDSYRTGGIARQVSSRDTAVDEARH